MAKLLSTGADLARQELLNAVIQKLASAPGSPIAGLTYYDTTLNVERFYNGTGWVSKDGRDTPAGSITSGMIADGTIVNADIAAGAAIALSKLAVDPLARANHTGTQLASTISNFDTQVRTSRIDQLAAAGADVSLGGFKITNLGTPTNGTDAVNKAYVDGVATGLDSKASVRVASTANVPLTTGLVAGQVIDGVTLVTGDRVLLKDQTTAAENGIYLAVASGTGVRATDADTSAEVNSGMFTFVEEGTTQDNTGWVLATNNPITLGTTGLTFVQFSSAGTILAGNGLQKVGSTLSVVAANTTISVTAGGVAVGTLAAGNFPTGGSAVITSGMIVDGTIVDADIAAGAAIARSKIAGATGKFAQDVGDASAVAFNIPHNLNSRDVVVSIRQNASPYAEVEADVEMLDVNNVTVRFGTAPTAAQYRVIVVG